ncbi:TPA: hypothetical protein GXZ34_00085 [bacterium]|nr:hypothetical protein [bacterium]
MKKHKFIVSIITFSLLVYSFVFIRDTNKVAINTLEVFSKSVLPALLPFLILNYLIIKMGLLDLIAYLFQFISYPLFGISGKGASIFLIGILNGFPSSAIFTSLLVKEKKISEKEGQSLVNAIFFPSFSFIFIIIGGNLKDDLLTLSLAVCLYLSGLFYLYFRNVNNKEIEKLISFKEAYASFRESLSKFNFINSLKEAIYNAFINLLNIAGIMVMFSLPYGILSKFLSEYSSSMISGLIEFSYASITLSNLAIDNTIKGISLVFILGFASLSTIVQASMPLKEAGLSIKSFVKARVTVAIFASFLLLVMLV